MSKGGDRDLIPQCHRDLGYTCLFEVAFVLFEDWDEVGCIEGGEFLLLMLDEARVDEAIESC